jgi:hypothetical protein
MVAGGCKKPPPRAGPAPIAALAAIPVDATVVIGIDVGRLVDSPLVVRAIEQMLLRDPELSDRIERLGRDCGVDVTRQVRSVFLALGPKSAPDAPQPSILVATGELSEAGLARCLQSGVGAGGATLSVKDVAGRRLYTLTEARRTLYFGFGQADTVVIGPSEAWVRTALSNDPKIERSPALSELLTKIDRTAAVWAAAVMDTELGAALANVTRGTVTAPPQALYGALDAADGLRAEIAFVMTKPSDSEALVSFARGELALLALAAQSGGLGSLVAKANIERSGHEIRFRIDLNDEELKQLLGAIDRGRPAGQDAQPVLDAGLSRSLSDLRDAGPSTTP